MLEAKDISNDTLLENKDTETGKEKQAVPNNTCLCQNSTQAKLTPEQKWRSLSTVCIILNVSLLLIILTVVIEWTKDRDKTEPLIPQTSTFCLPREEFSLYKDDDNENFKHFQNKTENGKAVLCTETGKHLDSLVNLYVEGKYRIERANEPYYSYCDGYTDSIRKPAAKVVGIEQSTPANDQSNTHIVHWDAAAEHSFVNDVTYKSGRFAIVKRGYYYIYSQVTYKETNEIDKPYTSHFIFRIKPSGNGEYTEKLLESSRSKCMPQTQTSNSTSYIGAVFYLGENHKVQVKVTHPEKIAKSKYSNYFGVHMV